MKSVQGRESNVQQVPLTHKTEAFDHTTRLQHVKSSNTKTQFLLIRLWNDKQAAVERTRGPSLIGEQVQDRDRDRAQRSQEESERERAAQDIAFERDYVLVEKRAVEVNALADELDASPRLHRGAPQSASVTAIGCHGTPSYYARKSRHRQPGLRQVLPEPFRLLLADQDRR